MTEDSGRPPEEPQGGLSLSLANYVRKNIALVACGVVALAIGAGALFLGRRGSAPGPEDSTEATRWDAGRPGFPSLAPGEDTSFPQSRSSQGTPGMLGPAKGKSYGFHKIVEILSSKASDPVARRFAEEFRKDPGLDKAWKEYEHTHDLGGFLTKIKASETFGRLLVDFGQDSRFKELVEELAAYPEFASAIRTLEAKMEARSPAVLSKTKAAKDGAIDEDFKYLTDPVMRVLGNNLFSRRLVSLGYGLDARERARLNEEMGKLKGGESAWEACVRSGLVRECAAMVNRCMTIAGCVDWSNEASATGGRGLHEGEQPQYQADAREDREGGWRGGDGGGGGGPCGNKQCEASESCDFCPEDCGSCPAPATCGNRECDDSETCDSCPKDCGSCSAAVASPGCQCTAWRGGSCGSGTCRTGERRFTRTCDPPDCRSERRCTDDASCASSPPPPTQTTTTPTTTPCTCTAWGAWSPPDRWGNSCRSRTCTGDCSGIPVTECTGSPPPTTGTTAPPPTTTTVCSCSPWVYDNCGSCGAGKQNRRRTCQPAGCKYEFDCWACSL